MRFTIIGYDGAVLFDSEEKDHKSMENHFNRTEVRMAKRGEEGFEIRKSKTLNDYYAYYAVNFDNLEDEPYIIRTSMNYESRKKQLGYFTFSLIIFFLILDIALKFFYDNFLKRDLEKKIDTMKKFLESGEDKKYLYNTKEEKWIFDFWSILKEWQENNLENIKKLDTEKNILSLILSSVDAFIGLIDNKGEYILKNDGLNHLFLTDKKRYNESFKHIEIITFIKDAMVQKSKVKEEIYITGLKEYFLVTVKYIDNTDQYLINIKDITTTKQAIEVQKTFINNVSHELKTPLTNIKGYLIAVKDAPKDVRKKFLGIIENNVNKLENTIMDFLNISKIENSKIMQITDIELCEIEKELNSALFNLLEKKGAQINLVTNFLKNRTFIRADKEKLMLILKNLTENGLIYNKSENPYVNIDIVEEIDRYKFFIRDNGIGIPQDKQKKIFERFYRVDKARTSNAGGTGLGLAIVKEIVHQFKGDIKLESVEGQGSLFRFYILK